MSLRAAALLAAAFVPLAPAGEAGASPAREQTTRTAEAPPLRGSTNVGEAGETPPGTKAAEKAPEPRRPVRVVYPSPYEKPAN